MWGHNSTHTEAKSGILATSDVISDLKTLYSSGEKLIINKINAVEGIYDGPRCNGANKEGKSDISLYSPKSVVHTKLGVNKCLWK